MSFRYKPRTWSVALVFGVVASLCTVGTAQAQAAPPAITTPEANGRLSIGTDDLDPDTAGFQLQIAGTADAGAEVTVEVKRPGGEYAAFGTDTAEGGNWSVEGTLDPGQWVARARTGEGEEQATSAEVPFAVALRYVFTFYDSVNSQLRNWVLAANPNDATAKVEIHVAGVPRATVDVAAGAAQARRFPDLAAGPVEVFSLDGVPLVTTQRTLWTNDDFEEVAGVYDGYLTNEAWFSWYDAVGTDARDWIVVTNMGTATSQVTVTVAGDVLAQPRDIAPGGSSAFREAGVRGGPVRVTASNNQPVLASRRTLWTPQNFVELPSIPDRWLEADYAFPWYDSIGTGNQTWIMVAAPTSTVGDTLVAIEPPGDAEAIDLVLEPGEVVARRFANTRGGPAFVTADQPVIATQRALWANGQSFEEVNGIQDAEITDVYHQTFYDTKNTGDRDWLLQASVIPPGTENGDVAYSITCPTIDHSSTLAPGEVEAPRFGDKAEGPCVIDGDGPFIQSRRTLWGAKGDFTELSGIRGSALSGAADQVAAPGSITVADVPNDDGTNLDVSWAPVDAASVDGYWVYREQSPLRRVAFLPASACGESSCGPVRDSGLDYETEARYRVVALSIATVEGIPALGAGTPIDNPPTAPTWPAEGAVVPGDAEVTLDWNDNPEPDVTGYNVYFVEDPQQVLPSACDQTVGAPADGDYTKHNDMPVAESTYTVDGLENDTRYCFQVTATDNSDEGESDRSEARDGTPSQMPPTVAVDSPEDGDVLEGGTTHTINYTAEDPNQDLESATVEYTFDSTAGTVVWNAIEGCEEPDGTCQWSVPEADTQNAQVRVTVTDSKDNTATDTTGDFAIDSSPPDVNVTAPTSEDSFQGGDTITIEWESNESNPADGGVDIHWTTNGTTFQEADGCQDTADDGSCDWTAPTIDSNTVQVRVTVTDEVGNTDSGISEQFTIATPPAAPTGLTAAPGDEQVDLDWDDNTDADLAGYNVYRAEPGMLETCADATYSKINTSLVLVSEYTDTGRTNDNEYCYRVSAQDETGTEGPQSGPVSATPEAIPPDVTVTEPAADDVLRGDGSTTYEIAWEDADPNEDFGFVRIEYSTNASASQQEGGPTWVTIEPAEDNDGSGSYDWDPPTSDSDDVQVRITATDQKGNTDQATSGIFSLDSTFPVVSNVTVSGGDGAPFKGGENVEITWETTEANPDHADLEYSTIGGTTWQPIASCTGIEDDGACSWTLPNLNSQQVRVRVTHTDAVGHAASAQSGLFTVDSISPNAPTITSIEEQTPPAVGNDTTPQVVVSLTTTEGGEVHIYVDNNPVCGAGTPAATKSVPAGDSQVTFNPTEDDDELTIGSQGNHNLFACHEDPSGNSSTRSDAARYTLDTQAPPAPSNVQASDNETGPGATVTWNGVNDNGLAGLAGYNVWRMEVAVPGPCPPEEFGTYERITSELVPAGGTTSYNDTSAQGGTSYCYGVSAVDNAGNEGDLGTATVAVTPS